MQDFKALIETNHITRLVNDNDDDVVDFSGEPQKYFGIYGKIIELSGLVIHEGECALFLLSAL